VTTRVLVVDDSAVARLALTQILTRARMAVTTAPDPIVALEKMARGPFDVVVLDIEMPRMDGLTFLRKVMAERPIPVVVCSGLAEEGSEVAIQALEEGAVDIVVKPRLGLQGFLQESAQRLVQVVRAAAIADVGKRIRAPRRVVPGAGSGRLPLVEPARGDGPTLLRTTHKVVVIGASTGGTEAIRVVLEALSPDAPGIAIVQHMPEYFTAQFAHRLDQTCRVEVKEAGREERLVSGRALIAPGNRHLVVRRSGAHYVGDLWDGPLTSRHRPSVDVLFGAAAEACGPNAMGVLLTGMGDDGAAGLLELRRAGAYTVAQDEATSVVFGMPKEAIVRGAVEDVLPIERIAAAIMSWAE
jgi:two-component system, chemotaxis family, protein-glutamate methylesterase/glutaminase